MDSSKFQQILPFKTSALWKGVGVGVAIAVLVLAVVVPNLYRARMAARMTGFYSESAAFLTSEGEGGGNGQSGEVNYVRADGPKVVYKAQMELLVGNCADAL